MQSCTAQTCEKEGQTSSLVGGSKILFRVPADRSALCLHTCRRLSPLCFMSDISSIYKKSSLSQGQNRVPCLTHNKIHRDLHNDQLQ